MKCFIGRKVGGHARLLFKVIFFFDKNLTNNSFYGKACVYYNTVIRFFFVFEMCVRVYVSVSTCVRSCVIVYVLPILFAIVYTRKYLKCHSSGTCSSCQTTSSLNFKLAFIIIGTIFFSTYLYIFLLITFLLWWI